jgi:PAS domain S-box-containing protein
MTDADRAGEADRRLRDAAREWQATFDALSDAVLLIDEQAVVHRANRAACELLCHHPDDILGRSLGELLQRQFDADSQSLMARLLEGKPMEKAPFTLGARVYLVTTALVHDVPSPEPRTVCVLEDVSERVAAEREREELLEAAEDARRDAEAANQAKNEFLAVMSHELRTPLNAIGGYAQLIELGIRGPVTDAQRADIDRIKRSQTYLLSLINDVLNFARIEAGNLKVELSDVDIGTLVLGMRDFVQPQLRERNLTFSCDCPPSIRVYADPEKVQQILINLLTNALKFTPPGGTISMRCETKDDEVIIAVCDTGRGISPDKLDSIFEPFVQVNRRYTREQEGIGLGLAISRELARAMGGDISVRSSEEEGSEFTLKLARHA